MKFVKFFIILAMLIILTLATYLMYVKKGVNSDGLRGTPPANDYTGQFCGGFAGIMCPTGYDCLLEGRYPDAGGTCVKSQSRTK